MAHDELKHAAEMNN